MILSRSVIKLARDAGYIVIEPFLVEHINPNSYNFRLGPTLREYCSDILDPRNQNDFVEQTIGPEGFVLEPGKLYLAHTIERLGGTVYAPTFAARSSIARLGLFINLSASLGDIGFIGQWTLQLYSARRLRVYAGMAIGQMMWWQVRGDVNLYEGKYQGAIGPRTSDIYLDYLKTEARANLPRLDSDFSHDDVGLKFATLLDFPAHFPSPMLS
ncbi:hypothetical protein [Ferrimicrobium sp.]|uniref:dCTP deaminase n=1 Tax=Ferrimicrobium sp. TaxID=2926050 RepID=UPI00260A9260|nr:hypothetical protein [Ferrimicrobium sp.]